MRIGLKTKLKNLEGKANMRFGTRLAVEYECDASGAPTDPFMRDWLSGVAPAKKTQQRADLAPSRPIYARRVILVPTFASAAAWEAALLKHQNELVALARSRTNEPAKAAPVSVGTKREAINEAAPLLAGTKRGRFIEMNDKRIFDREEGKFLDDEANETPGGLKAIFKR